jgi:hypothetical protein
MQWTQVDGALGFYGENEFGHLSFNWEYLHYGALEQ